MGRPAKDAQSNMHCKNVRKRVSAMVMQSCHELWQDAGKAHARLANMKQMHDGSCLRVNMLRDAMRPRGRNMQVMGAKGAISFGSPCPCSKQLKQKMYKQAISLCNHVIAQCCCQANKCDLIYIYLRSLC